MKLKVLKITLTVAALFAITMSAHAIGREDVLECGLPDGSKFVLRSKYDYSLIPIPLRHGSRKSNRTGWAARYIDKKGSEYATRFSEMYHGQAQWALRELCSYFGSLRGVPVAPATYFQKATNWFYVENYPTNRLCVEVTKERNISTGEASIDRLPPSVRALMDKAGIGGSVARCYIFPSDGRLLSEQPLYANTFRKIIDGDVSYDFVLSAVYQSFSTDNGKTWSDPIVTADAKIFEIGKSMLEQSFIARPISLNGEPITADFPAATAVQK